MVNVLSRSSRWYASIVLFVLVFSSCAQPAPATGEESAPSDPSPPQQLSIDPKTATDHWYQGDHATAVEIYRRLVAKDPTHQDYRLSLVVLLREMGNIEGAVRYSRDLTGIDAIEHEMNMALAGIGLSETGTEVGGAGTMGTEVGVEEGIVEESVGEHSEGSRYHFWRGLRSVIAGAYDQGSDHFTLALDTAEDGHFPYAHFAIGHLAAGRGDYKTARDSFLDALRQDGNLTEVFLPLAKVQWQLGDYRAAWDRLERARIARPWDESIPRLLAVWEEERPSLTADADTRAAVRRAASTPPRVATSRDRYEEEELLRVGLVENVDSVYLKTGGPFVLTVDERIVFEHPNADTDVSSVLHIVTNDGEITVTEENGDTLYHGDHPVRLEYRDRSYTTTIFDMTYGHGQFSSGREDRSYRGEIEIIPRGSVCTVVNRLSVEEYLYSVVPSEMPAWWPKAALEAQAIAARSYTLYPRNRYEDRGFDLLSSVTSAYYPGVTNEHARTTAAVDATRGLVLKDGSRPLDAVYSANHAGYAEAAGSVWGWPNSLVATSDPLLPPLETRRSPGELYRWLISNPDSYSGRAPYASRSSYRWNLIVPRETIEQRLADSGRSVGTIQRIVPGPRGITGRVEEVTVHGTAGKTVVRRDAVRSRLGGLRSNLFVVSAYIGPDIGSKSLPEQQGAYTDKREPAPSYFFFQGAGWGHGVGLDQTGAAGMAEAGFDAEMILNHYYPRNEIVEWY